MIEWHRKAKAHGRVCQNCGKPIMHRVWMKQIFNRRPHLCTVCRDQELQDLGVNVRPAGGSAQQDNREFHDLNERPR